MVDCEQKNVHLGRILIYIEMHIASKSFKHTGLIPYIVTEKD